MRVESMSRKKRRASTCDNGTEVYLQEASGGAENLKIFIETWQGKASHIY
jgi:hypothetical protein